MAELIIRHPDLAKDCLLYRMTPADWRRVVEKHPQVLSLYRKTCLHSEKSIFNLNRFIDVIRIVPQEAWQHVDWAQFYSDGCEDWKCILAQLPDTALYLGRQFLPDDLLEAMDFIVQHGYEASLYVWTVWRKDIVGFTEKELYSEIEIVERLHHHPELWNMNALVEKIRTLFYGRYEAAYKSGKTKVEWLKDIVRKYSSYPLFVSHAIEWFGVGLSWQSWEKLLEFDYSVFEVPCLKFFSCWFNGLEIAELRKLHTDIPSFALWHRALLAVLKDSPLEKRNHEYLKIQLLKLWEERERKKAQRKAREARRRKRFS